MQKKAKVPELACFERGYLISVFNIDPSTGITVFDETYNDDRFKGDTVGKLVKLIQNGDKDAHEEMYYRLYPDFIRLTKAMASRYHHLEDDESEVSYIIYNATETAIRTYNPAKGQFPHLWRTVLKTAKFHFIREKLKASEVNTCQIDYDTDLIESEVSVSEANEIESEYLYEDYLVNLYNEEEARQVLDFVRKRFKSRDYRLVVLWSQSYTLDEIRSMLHISRKKMLTRLYNIMNAAREYFNRGKNLSRKKSSANSDGGEKEKTSLSLLEEQPI